MRIKLIKPADMKMMPWKNGMGSTAEVAISPASAQLANLDFDWRVSIATISASSPFSKFPGYSRQIVVWKGEGLSINGIPKRTFEDIEFSGTEDVTAKLLTNEVKDFGIIFRADRVRSEITVHQLGDGDGSQVTIDGNGFVLCGRGEIRVGEFYLNPGDVIHASGSGVVRIQALERSTYVFADLKSF